MSAKNIRELVEQAQLQEYKKELYYIWSGALNQKKNQAYKYQIDI